MRYTVCCEEMEGRWIAHVPALWGCYASAADRPAALAALPAAIAEYWAWRGRHGESAPAAEPAVDLDVEETVREWLHPAVEGYVVNAFFASDASPVTGPEIEQLHRLLAWSRADLLAAADGLPDGFMEQPVEGEWNIAGILNHTARAERWYLDRLDLAQPAESAGTSWRERLDISRARLLEILPDLGCMARVEVKNGELWSPRKLLRRALWHERDHTQHILQFRARLEGLM